MSITADSFNKISPDLSVDARQHYTQWIISCNELADLKSTPLIRLRNLIPSDADWAAAHPDEPRVPVLPEPLGNNPNAGTIATWRYATEIGNQANFLTNEFKAAVITSLGVDIDRETCVGTTGHTTQSTAAIFDLVKTGYGTLDSSDIAKLEASLVLQPDKSFRANMAHFQHVFTALGALGLYQAEYAQMIALENACKSTSTESIASAYKHQFPLLADRSFAAMTAYIEARIPNLTASAVGYAGKAEATTTTQLLKELADLRATLAAATSIQPVPTGRGGRGGGRTTGRDGRGNGNGRGNGRGAGRATPQMQLTPKVYCFAHGYGEHLGSICSKMANDPSYTDGMKAATAPCVIDGYQGRY